MPVDEAVVRDLIARLDAAVPRETGRLEVEGEGGLIIQANAAGFLRLGIELQKAAFAESAGTREPDEVPVDLAYLLRQEEHCYQFLRRDEPRWGEPEAQTGNAAPAVLGLAIVLFLLASLAVGVVIVAGFIIDLLMGLLG